MDCSKNNIIYKNEILPRVSNPLNYAFIYSDYQQNVNTLNIYKLTELKQIAKQYNLHISGTKQLLVDRIIRQFNKISKIIILQKIYRGYLVRESIRLRGGALNDRKICVNSSDFYSLEPIADIDHRSFFSYNDDKLFWYGFDIESIFLLISKTPRLNIINPYNRENISPIVINNIISLRNKIRILFPDIIIQHDILEQSISMPTIHHIPTISNTLGFNRINTPEIRRLNRIREGSIQTRIQELFMEIDQLGNYTQTEWFATLTRVNYIRLYRLLYNIWRRLSIDVRTKISILGDPFLNIFQNIIHLDDIGYERIQEACLRVFENMVFTGVDIEYRRLGALHVLSALTIVSLNARISMPWLYESFM
jgi:hypothetical protein